MKKHFYKEPVTFQDSCNFIRNAGYFEDSRKIMRHIASDLREMNPHGVHTYCCGVGGGHALMPEFKKTRLATSKAKAEVIRRTGAETVVVACHNCEDGIKDGMKEFGVQGEVSLMCNFVAPAVDLGD